MIEASGGPGTRWVVAKIGDLPKTPGFLIIFPIESTICFYSLQMGILGQTTGEAEAQPSDHSSWALMCRVGYIRRIQILAGTAFWCR